MKATAQYDDFIGTGAADISDHFTLNDFLNEKGVNTEIYSAIGASFYHGEHGFFMASIICKDLVQSTENSPYYVKLSFEDDITYPQFFNLFKRFSVDVTTRFLDHDQVIIKEEITIDSSEE